MAIDSIPFPFYVSEVQITRADGPITEFPATTALKGALEVLDGEAYLATMAPEQRELLDGKLRLLDSRMLTYYPVPAPDQLLSTKVGALSHDRPGAAVGSIVWTQVTNTGVVSFVLPNIRFNQQANTYEYLPMPEASIAPPVAPAAASASSPFDLVLSFVKIGAPILPAPFGAVVGATTSLLQLILGTTKTSEDPVKATVEQLEQYKREQQLANWATQLNVYASWLDDQVATLAATACANTDYIETELRPTISEALSPNLPDSLLGIVQRLVSTQFPYIDPAAAEYSSKAVGLLQQGIALLFTYYKTLVQLEATIAANYFNAQDFERFTNWNNLWVTTCVGWKATALDIQGRCADRLQAGAKGWDTPDVVGPLYRYDAYTEHVHCQSVGGDVVCDNVNYPGGYACDEWPKMSRKVRRLIAVDDTTKGSGCDAKTVKHKDVAAQQRNGFINGAKAPYTDALELAKQWACMPDDQWLPRRPPDPPTLAATITGWSASTPQGKNWLMGARVRYCVCFVSADGPSSLGPWSHWYTIDDKAFPTLELPVAPNQSRTNQVARRIVIRQFDNDTAVSVGEIKDNVTTTFSDKML